MTIRIILGTLFGGGIGFLIGYFCRCNTGVCPLYRNPYSSTIIGIIFGLMIAVSIK